MLEAFTVTEAGISRNVVFADPSLFPAFGLPTALDGTFIASMSLPPLQ